MKHVARVGLVVSLLAGLCVGQVNPKQGRAKSVPGRGGSPSTAEPNAPKGIYPTAHGIVKSISGSQLFVAVDEDHEMKFRLIHKTKIYIQGKDPKDGLKEIKASALEPGQKVDIDMQNSLDGAFEAVRITVVP